jgi:rubrerythrin
MNIFDFAIKMEVDGKNFYEKMASESRIAGLKTIFSRLAEDEQKHFDIFQALKGQTQKAVMEDSTVLEKSRNIFEELLQGGVRPEPVATDLEGYQYAMKLEEDSFRLYEDAAAKEQNVEVKHLLLRIAKEERNHFAILQNIFDFVNAPNEYLAWREFSNLDEFRQFGRDID